MKLRQPKITQLMTEYGEKLREEQTDADTTGEKNILSEYPRPQMIRDHYMCLNGKWDYAINELPTWFDKTNSQAADGRILVPFSPESFLSGVNRLVLPEEWLHYRRNFYYKKPAKGHVLLHFGAVDQKCSVYLNGIFVGAHNGGYLSFTMDITEHLRCDNEENVLCLDVKDQTENSPHARGKQKLVRKGGMASIFYTPQSGIWKTVWMEWVPDNYIVSLKLTPDIDEGVLRIKINTSGTCEAFEMQEKSGATEAEAFVVIRLRD